MERIAPVGGVEKDQCQVGVIEEECIDQPVIGLPGEVPEHGFALGAVPASGA